MNPKMKATHPASSTPSLPEAFEVAHPLTEIGARSTELLFIVFGGALLLLALSSGALARHGGDGVYVCQTLVDRWPDDGVFIPNGWTMGQTLRPSSSHLPFLLLLFNWVPVTTIALKRVRNLVTGLSHSTCTIRQQRDMLHK